MCARGPGIVHPSECDPDREKRLQRNAIARRSCATDLSGPCCRSDPAFCDPIRSGLVGWLQRQRKREDAGTERRAHFALDDQSLEVI